MKKALIITLAVALQAALVCTGSLWARQDQAEQALRRERQVRLDWDRDRARNRKIDYPTFMVASREAYDYRKNRRISVDQFLEMAKDKDTIILDTRSKAKFDEIHIAGATHLNFSDFTADTLAEVIPSKDTRILIYCNNNFELAKTPKKAPVRKSFGGKYEPMALNIPTFINLYGYGYRNIYELAPAVDFTKTKLKFESGPAKTQKVAYAAGKGM